MRTIKNTAALGLMLLAGSTLAWADDASPVGLWKNIDDVTGKPKALIRISESGGVYQGKIEKLIRAPEEEQNPKCAKCDGANKDQPVIGMTIVWDIRQDGDEYGGGRILDPSDGKIYKSKFQLSDGGKKLQLRAYFGVPMLGRSQVWIRQD